MPLSLQNLGGYINCIYKLTGLEVSPGVKKTLVFRTFDVKFNAEGFMKLYAKSDEKAENGTKSEKSNGKSEDTEIAEKANGPKSSGHQKEETKEKVISNKKEKNNLSNGHKLNENANHVNGANGKANSVNGEVGKANGKTNGVNGEKANDVNEESDKEKPSIFSRLTEYMIMHEVSKYGLCQPVYAKYSNGICYGYAEGTTLTGSLMNSEEYLQEAASKLARFHSIKYEIPNLQFKTRYDRTSDELREAYFGEYFCKEILNSKGFPI